jgi:hypothetical protein
MIMLSNLHRIASEVPMSRLYIDRLAALLVATLIGALPGTGHAQVKTFPSADAAASAFVNAVAISDKDAVRAMLGPDYAKVLQLDKVSEADKVDFLAAWADVHRVVPQGDNKAILEVGKSAWPMPIPMVKSAAGWHFDTRAGADNLVTWRIGRNELAAMEATLAYYDAQKEYAGKERQPGQGLTYAQKLISSPGKKDGLYWPTAAGEEPSPIGPAYTATDPDGAYHGYYYRILTSQGKNANGGAYDYRIKGRMSAGFALIAWPARYGHSGIMSFMVNHDGVVFQKDLGPNTASVARGIQRFDHDTSWTAVLPPSELAARSGGTK